MAKQDLTLRFRERGGGIKRGVGHVRLAGCGVDWIPFTLSPPAMARPRDHRHGLINKTDAINSLQPLIRDPEIFLPGSHLTVLESMLRFSGWPDQKFAKVA